MLSFFASDWNQIIREFESLTNVLNVEAFTDMIEGRKGKILDPLERIATLSKKLGLVFTASYATKIIGIVSGSPSLLEEMRKITDGIEPRLRIAKPPNLASALDPNEIRREISVLRQRFDDELSGREFLALETGNISYFKDRDLFGEGVTTAFPSAIVNIGEAGKCLALDRGTACVFHLMRVMESGLKATAKALGIPYAPSWEAYLRQIDDRVQQKHKKKGIKWKRDESFFKDVSAHLHSVKSAWRNPTMHIVRDYNPEQAEEVFRSVRAFMRHLASRLSE